MAVHNLTLHSKVSTVKINPIEALVIVTSMKLKMVVPFFFCLEPNMHILKKPVFG